MSYRAYTAKAATKVKAKLSQQYTITNSRPGSHFLYIQIYWDGHGVTLCQTAYITSILRRFDTEYTHAILTVMDRNLKLDLAENWGENELDDITYYQAVMGSRMYAELATWQDMSDAIAALSCYNSRPFTHHMTAAKRVLQYLKSTANF